MQKQELKKMGRKEKLPEDRIRGEKVYLNTNEITVLEGLYGSLTNAIKAALPPKEAMVYAPPVATNPVTNGKLTKEGAAAQKKLKPNTDFLERRRNSKNAVKSNS